MSVQRRLILGVVTDINTSIVTYPSCTQCYTKLLIDPTNQRYHCIRCGISVPYQNVQWRYRLVLTIADSTAVCRVVVFGRTLDPFFGKTATDFHRSLTNLGKSGYPAEALLSDALMKTFHGKYFYFGLKLDNSPNSASELTLSDVAERVTWNTASQSALNNTDVSDPSHILVYQMLASNDGVYATVTDFMRSSIKQLRQTGTSCQAVTDSVDKSSSSWKYNSNWSIGNYDSNLYTPASFHSKQKSVAFSFETSSEDSSVFVDKGNNTSVSDLNESYKPSNHERPSGAAQEDTTGIDCIVLNNPRRPTKHDKSSDISDSLQQNIYQGGLTSSLGNAEKRSKHWTNHLNRIKSLPEFVSEHCDISSSFVLVTQKLDFSNLTDSDDQGSTSQRIDKELKKRVIKQQVSLIKQRTLSQPSYTTCISGSSRKHVPRNDCTNLLEKVPLKNDFTDISYKQKSTEACTDDMLLASAQTTQVTNLSQHDIYNDTYSNSTQTSATQTQFQCRIKKVTEPNGHGKFGKSPLNNVGNSDGSINDDFEELLIMPDSEGLQTFLDDNQQDIWDESNIQHNIDMHSVNTYRTDKLNESRKTEVLENADSEQFVDVNGISSHNTSEMKEIPSSENTTSKMGKAKKDVNDFIELQLPDSEELEAFLETFNDDISLEDEHNTRELDNKLKVSQKNTSYDNCENKCVALSNNKESVELKTEVHECNSKYLHETPKIKQSNTMESGYNGDINGICIADSQELEGFLNTEDEVSKGHIMSKNIDKEGIDVHVAQLPDSEELEAFLETFTDCLSLADESTCNTYEINKKDSHRDDHKRPSTNECSMDLNMTSTAVSQSRNTDDGTVNNSDSGVQLSTSSIDLFASFDSTTDSPDYSDNKSANSMSETRSSNGSVNNNVKHFEIKTKKDKTTEDNIEVAEDRLNELINMDEAFDDSWSQLLQDELGEHLNELNHFGVNSSSKPDNKIDALTNATKDQTVNPPEGPAWEMDKPTVLSVDSDGIDTEKELRDQCDTEGSTSFDSSDILFDSPEMLVPHTRVFMKPVSCYLSKNLNFSKQLSNSSLIISSGANSHTLDVGVICESQSSFFESQKSSLPSYSVDQSRLGELNQGRKVVFSKKLRRVSSCRLMDIRMKENRSPLLNVIPNPKSCLKPSNQFNSKYVELLVGDGVEREPGPITEEQGTPESDRCFIESSQTSTPQPEGSAKTTVCTINLSCNGKTSDDGNSIPCTPDLWGSSFEESIIDASLEMSSDFNRALALDTPVRSDGGVHSETDLRISRTQDTRDVSQVHDGKTTNKLSNIICLDSPDIFSQIATTTAKFLINEETLNRKNVLLPQSTRDNSFKRKVLKCIASDTPTDCDNTVMSKRQQSDGKENNFSPDNIVTFKCENEYSPDLFGDDVSFEDCDTETNACNVPSVLCKQLFF